MMAARALFAFQVGELEGEEPKEPSTDALLGALLQSEERAVLINLRDILAEFIQHWAKVQKARGKRPTRRR